jgi:transducin (beta)-like 1
LESERPVYDFKDHEREVTSLSWSSSQSILASSSLDTTTRLWDIQTGTCTKVLDKHVHPVILVRFSADGKQLATASNDRVFVWSCNSGSMTSTFKCQGGINDLAWDPDGLRLSLACSNNNLSVVDLRL